MIAGKDPVGENCLQLAQHVGEDETELGEVATVVRVLVEHLHLSLLEQLYGLLALSHQIIDEDVEVLVGVEDVHLVLVLGVDQVQSLVGVGQDVEDEGRAVLEVHLALLTELHHFVHELPCFLERFLVRHELLLGAVAQFALDLREECQIFHHF